MSEKRQYFRIQQDVIFNFKVVSTDDVCHINADQHFDHADALELVSQFQRMDNDCNGLLNQIKQEQPITASYLEIINQKLNRLSQQLLAHEAVAVNDSESGKIDLSLGGIGFNSDRMIGVESWLAVKLVFLPAYVGLITYSQVTRTQAQEDGSWLIGARFHQLNNEQQRVLSRQVMQAQFESRESFANQVRH